MTPLEQLEDAINDLTADDGLLAQLRELLPTPSGTTGEGGTHQKVSGSPAPWNGAAGGVLMAIHAGARRLENQLRERNGWVARQRGGSDENTIAALHAIQLMAEIAPDFTVRDALQQVLGWVNTAKRVHSIGEAAAWVPLPREPGQQAFPCPHCGFFSLRMCKPLGTIRCTTRSCRNDDNRRPTWLIEELLGERAKK